MWRRRKPPARTKERIAVGRAIRSARRGVGLTQEQLGKRLGIDSQAIYRWECAVSTPSKRHERELIRALHAIHPPTAAWLVSALNAARPGEKKQLAAVAPAALPVTATVELAVFALAEDLELAPRRVRSALVPFLRRLREASVPVADAERELERLLQAAPVAIAQVAAAQTQETAA